MKCLHCYLSHSGVYWRTSRPQSSLVKLKLFTARRWLIFMSWLPPSSLILHNLRLSSRVQMNLIIMKNSLFWKNMQIRLSRIQWHPYVIRSFQCKTNWRKGRQNLITTIMCQRTAGYVRVVLIVHENKSKRIRAAFRQGRCKWAITTTNILSVLFTNI